MWNHRRLVIILIGSYQWAISFILDFLINILYFCLLAILSNKNLLLLMVRQPSKLASTLIRISSWRYRLITYLVHSVQIWTLSSVIIEFSNTRSWAHWSVACVSCRNSNHKINIFLNVVNESFNHVYLLRTSFYQFLNRMIYLLLVLAGVAHLQEFFLCCPLRGYCTWSVIIYVNRILVVIRCRVGHALLWLLIHICIRVVIFKSVLIYSIEHLCMTSSVHWCIRTQISSVFTWISEILLLFFLLLKLNFLLFDQLLNEFLLIDLILSRGWILVNFFLHYKYRLMCSVFNELVFNVFKHHIKSILYIVFCSSRHFFNYFWPFVSYCNSFFQDQYIFLKTEWIFFDFRIQKVDPSFSALLSVSICAQNWI